MLAQDVWREVEAGGDEDVLSLVMAEVTVTVGVLVFVVDDTEVAAFVP